MSLLARARGWLRDEHVLAPADSVLRRAVGAARHKARALTDTTHGGAAVGADARPPRGAGRRRRRPAAFAAAQASKDRHVEPVGRGHETASGAAGIDRGDLLEAGLPVAPPYREPPRGGAGEIVLPQVIVDAGPSAVARFLEFFAGRIANARTRAAYGRAVGQFLGWCEARGLGLRDVSPLHVAAYIRTHPGSVPTVKQHLAAIERIVI